MTTSAYDGKTVLVTGGTGSFGHTVVDRVLQTDAAEIRVFSRDEAKQDAMRHHIGDPRVNYVIGDVRDASTLMRVCQGVDHIFHAAALKQVPSCEFFPDQAVATNIIGSKNLLDAAEANGVDSVVCLSTDKAVYPVNAMGLSKAVMEKIARAHVLRVGGAHTRVSCVRYGNVMYSRGSVIPLFVDQIRQGRELTITEPRMTRFMMTLAESVDLVEQAFAKARSGDIFIQKAPATTVGDLAEVLCELFAVAPRIKIIGIRHGEKLHETLATREELAFAEDHGKFLRLPSDDSGLNYEQYVDRGIVGLKIDEDFDSDLVTRLSRPALALKLLEVPELRADLAQAGRDPKQLDECYRAQVERSGSHI